MEQEEREKEIFIQSQKLLYHRDQVKNISEQLTLKIDGVNALYEELNYLREKKSELIITIDNTKENNESTRDELSRCNKICESICEELKLVEKEKED